MRQQKQKGTWRIVLAGILIALMTVAALLALPPVRRALNSAAVTINLLAASGSWRPLELLTTDPARYDVTAATNDGRDITVRVFTTQSATDFGLVVYTPLIGGGLDDERLVNLAGTWARAGVPVAVPWSDDGIAINPADIEEVMTAAQVLQDETGVTRLGLFGISYGAGPMFAAAVDERLADNVSLIVSLNGFHDLADVVAFIDSGQSHEYGRDVVAATRAAGTNLADVHQLLSPASHVTQLAAPVYIIHSISDRFIPFEQSEKLQQALQDQGKQSTLVLTDVIEHGSYRPPTPSTLIKHYLPAGWSFTILVYEILAHR